MKADSWRVRHWSRTRLQPVSADTLRDIIANGKHRMPKFGEKLPAPDIDSLVTQIKAQQIEAHKKP